MNTFVYTSLDLLDPKLKKILAHFLMILRCNIWDSLGLLFVLFVEPLFVRH